jgi:hypothetical protein
MDNCSTKGDKCIIWTDNCSLALGKQLAYMGVFSLRNVNSVRAAHQNVPFGVFLQLDNVF